MEEGKSTLDSLGAPLKVPNVQALAAATNGSGEVPPKYIRPEMEAHGDGGDIIPVVDMSRLLDPQLSEEESLKLNLACQEWGFFQLVNHGVPEEILERTASDVQEFFKLPLKEKEAFAQLPGSMEGYGQAFVVTQEQNLDWADILLLTTQPSSFRKMKFWPTNPRTFRDTFNAYSSQLEALAATLLRILSKILGIDDPDVILKRFGEQTQTVRINYYPPCPEANKVLGLSPHTDAGVLTFLLEANGVQGLQIKKDEKWHSVKTIPGALVVNIGDVLEIMTNGRYKSIEHRAIINPEKERVSIAAFHSLSFDAMIGPLPELVSGESGEQENYKTMAYANYLKLYFTRELEGRNLLNSMKLKN